MSSWASLKIFHVFSLNEVYCVSSVFGFIVYTGMKFLLVLFGAFLCKLADRVFQKVLPL